MPFSQCSMLTLGLRGKTGEEEAKEKREEKHIGGRFSTDSYSLPLSSVYFL